MEQMHEFWCLTADPETMVDKMETKLCTVWYSKRNERNNALRSGRAVPPLSEEDRPPEDEVNRPDLKNTASKISSSLKACFASRQINGMHESFCSQPGKDKTVRYTTCYYDLKLAD